MIGFLLKGILRDKSRSVLPLTVISLGAALTVLLSCWLRGVIGQSIEINARFTTGHVKVVTRAYAGDQDQIPNDLAIIGADSLTGELREKYPGMDWVQRIRFGGLIDFPDEKGETRVQGTVAGWAADLLSPDSREITRLDLKKSLVAGTLPAQPGQALITSEFAERFKIAPGDRFSFFGTTMDGGMAIRNFTVSGTLRFGSPVLDRGAIIVDLEDARQALGMEDAAGEILGFFPSHYQDQRAAEAAKSFNDGYFSVKDEYAPVMISLRDQGGMAEFLDYTNSIGGIMIFGFVLALSVVLWNSGLLGGLRRYGEFGLRLALGEDKKHLYWSLLGEAVILGTIGSIIGTSIGLALAYYLQAVGFDTGKMMQGSSLLMPTVVRASVSSSAYFIGFIPGLLSVVLGNALSGLGIYRRKTAQLFKELEV